MRRGLTLIETLIALGTVTVLLAVTVPGLRSLRESARTTECAANLRQMAAGALSYANVNREAMPPAIIQRWRNGQLVSQCWDWETASTGPGAPPASVAPGVLWNWLDGGERTLQCPLLEPGLPGSDPFTGYNYNTTFIGAEGSLPGPGPDGAMVEGWANARLGVPASQFRRPGEAALFGDAGWKGGPNKFMRAPMNSVELNLSVVYAGGQAFRHSGGCNVAWLDGHVTCTRECCKGALAQPGLLSGVMDWPRNGFLSEDDSAYDPR